MLKQFQAKAKKAQVTSIGTMDAFDPVIALGKHTAIHDPDIGQASRDHQASQSRWIRDVTLVQLEAAALLVGEEGFDAKPFRVPMTGFSRQLHMGDWSLANF